MRQLLFTIISFVALLFSNTYILAYDFEVDGICYNITSNTDKTVEVTYHDFENLRPNYYKKYNGNVNIPEFVTYNGINYNVTHIDQQAFDGCTGLISIVISNSVISIDRYAFSDCSGLTSVKIGNSVTSIGERAFWCCYSLTSIEIPKSVTSIDNAAFSGTAWYNNKPDGLVYINNVLYDYKGTIPLGTTIEIKDGTVSISPYAFYGCSGLTLIKIPNSVTSIGESAFANCSDLTSIEIPNSVKCIGYSAFYGCSELKKLTIGCGIETIGGKAFRKCEKLEELYVLSRIAVECEENVFSKTAYNNAILYVPEGREFAYQKTFPWSNFYIQPISTSIGGIETINTNDLNSPIYNLKGFKMLDAVNLPRGIYIKNGKKFIVR